jgi:hypothetical protein
LGLAVARAARGSEGGTRVVVVSWGALDLHRAEHAGGDRDKGSSRTQMEEKLTAAGGTRRPLRKRSGAGRDQSTPAGRESKSVLLEAAGVPKNLN